MECCNRGNHYTITGKFSEQKESLGRKERPCVNCFIHFLNISYVNSSWQSCGALVSVWGHGVRAIGIRLWSRGKNQIISAKLLRFVSSIFSSSHTFLSFPLASIHLQHEQLMKELCFHLWAVSFLMLATVMAKTEKSTVISKYARLPFPHGCSWYEDIFLIPVLLLGFHPYTLSKSIKHHFPWPIPFHSVTHAWQTPVNARRFMEGWNFATQFQCCHRTFTWI